jgi:uncharacterized protein (DUF2141 family)
VPAGSYAVVVFHDENDNGKIDRSVLGIPREDYGFSNNPKLLLRKPTFDEARFAVDAQDATIAIRLIHWP